MRVRGSAGDQADSGQTMDFAIFQFMNGVDEEDCEMVVLSEPLRILLNAEE